jgi:hypothetical protein
MKFSLFKNSRADKPDGTLTLEQLLDHIRDGTWSKLVHHLRSKSYGTPAYKSIKEKLPAVTISGDFKTRNKQLPLDKRLRAHTGLICLDIDKKDNPKMRTKDLVDKDCIAQFVSCGGEGIKIIYQCTPVTTAEEHRRIYDACVKRLEDKGVHIKVDPIVKSIAGLQYISYDPHLFHNPKTKLVIKPLAEKKRKVVVKGNVEEELKQLNEYIDALGTKDVTKTYENWMLILFGLSHSFGEAGRPAMHRICKNYAGYSKVECDEKYDSFLEIDPSTVSKPVTLATVLSIINEAIPKSARKLLGKKYSKSHAIGEAEDVIEQGDLSGYVRYKLFLFKKVIDKQNHTIAELIPSRLNLNAFENLLKEMGFYRYEKWSRYVHITNNIVEECDTADILRMVTAHIEKEGDYEFSYKKVEYKFSWEEIVHLWREIRAMGTMHNQIASSLPRWEPNLLKDTATESWIPYRNGVAAVTASEIKLIPYKDLKQQIWKERILPRDFNLNTTKGMFEEFFANVMGRGKASERTKSIHYERALWYYGYMLQGSKRMSTARAWILYDIKMGNSGRTGKTIIGTAVSKIRSVTVIDGKQVNLKDNRFAFQTVQPWTDVIFIDDPSKYMSLVPLFNMITGQTSAEKKGLDPIVKDLKIMIASNWVLEAEGTSESGRQFVSQLDDYYVRWSKEHKDTITPIVDAHGKEFFTDWNDKDWAQFDTFSLRALQFHLKGKLPTNVIIGSSSMIRFVQLHEEELFMELAMALVTHMKQGQDKRYTIVQQILTGIIKENNTDLKANKAGKIAREFLNAVGCKDIQISTSRIAGGLVRMAYSFTGEPEFGEYTKQLQK